MVDVNNFNNIDRAYVHKVSREMVSTDDVAYKYDHLDFARYVDGDFFTATKIQILTGEYKGAVLDRDFSIDDGRLEYSAYFGNGEVTYNLRSYHFMGVKVPEGKLTNLEYLQRLADDINKDRRKYAKESAIKKELDENENV